MAKAQKKRAIIYSNVKENKKRAEELEKIRNETGKEFAVSAVLSYHRRAAFFAENIGNFVAVRNFGAELGYNFAVYAHSAVGY